MRRLVEITDPRVAKAIAHPLRRELLKRLTDREASASELAAELQQAVPVVSYHVRKLAELELVELARTRPRRGATERYYRAIGETYFPGETLTELPQPVRDALVGSWWQRLAEDVAAGFAAHGWDRPEAQALRSSLTLDEQGWRDLAEAAEALHTRALELEAESRARLAGAASARPAVFALLLFESGPNDVSSASPSDPASRKLGQ